MEYSYNNTISFTPSHLCCIHIYFPSIYIIDLMVYNYRPHGYNFCFKKPIVFLSFIIYLASITFLTVCHSADLLVANLSTFPAFLPLFLSIFIWDMEFHIESFYFSPLKDAILLSSGPHYF